MLGPESAPNGWPILHGLIVKGGLSFAEANDRLLLALSHAAILLREEEQAPVSPVGHEQGRH